MGVLGVPSSSYADEVSELCAPIIQQQKLLELLSNSPDNEKLAKAAEYFLHVRSTLKKKGLPVPSIETFCEQFKKEHPGNEVAARLTEEILKKKDMDPESFFLPISNYSIEDNPYFEEAVDDYMWGVGESIMSVFFFFFGQHSASAISAGQAYRNFDSSYKKLQQAKEYEEMKRENNETDDYNEDII